MNLRLFALQYYSDWLHFDFYMNLIPKLFMGGYAVSDDMIAVVAAMLVMMVIITKRLL